MAISASLWRGDASPNAGEEEGGSYAFLSGGSVHELIPTAIGNKAHRRLSKGESDADQRGGQEKESGRGLWTGDTRSHPRKNKMAAKYASPAHT